MKTRRALLVEPRRFELVEADLTPGEGQLLVRIAVCGLCNWELNHWKGRIGEGHPQTLGHEWAGTVVEIGRGVTGFAAGDTVTGLPANRATGPQLEGFADYMVADAACCVKVGASVDPMHAIGEPLKCILTVLRGAAPEAGDVGVVLGCGPMGLWCVQALSGGLLSALIAVDVDDAKLALARKYGATHTLNPRTSNVEEAIRDIGCGRLADFVIEGTGNADLLNTAIGYLREGRGRLALMSSYERTSASFDVGAVVGKAVEIRGLHPGYSLDGMDDLRRAVRLLERGTFRMDGLYSHRFKLEDVQAAFETLERKPPNYLKGVVLPKDIITI